MTYGVLFLFILSEFVGLKINKFDKRESERG